MRNTILWERYAGMDGHADEVYMEPVELKCWIEDRGGFGGVVRNQSVGATEYDPKTDVFMDAQDIDVATITMRDRFTYTMNGQQFKTQPDKISVVYGPDGVSPWLVAVTT